MPRVPCGSNGAPPKQASRPWHRTRGRKDRPAAWPPPHSRHRVRPAVPPRTAADSPRRARGVGDANDEYQWIEVAAQFLRQSALALGLAGGRCDLGLSSIVELTQAQVLYTTWLTCQDFGSHLFFCFPSPLLGDRCGMASIRKSRRRAGKPPTARNAQDAMPRIWVAAKDRPLWLAASFSEDGTARLSAI